MFKKIIIFSLLIISLIMISKISFSACSYNWWNIAGSIDSCLSSSSLVDATWDISIEVWFKNKILDWVKNIASFLWLVAIWAIVWGWFMMVISTWEEEKIKKAKDMVKWAIFWFLWIVLASSLIALVVNFMYSLK